MFKKFAAFAAIILLVSLASGARAVSAKAYALVEQTTGRLISGGNAGQRLPMASTTKIMTALLAVESGRLDEQFTVPAEALCVEGSTMGLVADETITLRDLTYGLMLESGNDAANTIAFMLGGSVPGFAAMMNRRAEQLGLRDTQFRNPSGLDADGHYTTALDLARLGAAAMKNSDFAGIVGTQKIAVTYNGTPSSRWLFNHNRLLGSYEGEIGIKTGFTKKCGRCLVSCARRNGVTLVLSTLDDPDDWKDHKELLDSGFSLLKTTGLLASPPKLTAQVVGGTAETVDVQYDPAVSAALADSEKADVTMEIDMDRFYYAPVKQGQKLGKLVFRVKGDVVAETDLTAAQPVEPEPPKPNVFVRLYRFLFRR